MSGIARVPVFFCFLALVAGMELPCAAISATASGDWWDADWANRRRVYLETSDLTENLSNFPLSIRLKDAEALVANAQPTGNDLRVISADGEPLEYELVAWGPGLIEIVARVPQIAAKTPGQFIDVYYGNPNAAAPPAADVWDEAYRAVLHLNGDARDASGANASVTLHGDVQIIEGATFGDREGFLQLGSTTLTGIGEQLTISVRFRVNAGPDLQTLVSGQKTDGTDEWFNFGLKLPNSVHTNAASRGHRAPELNPPGVARGEWHSAVVRYDARDHTRTICIDGIVFESDKLLPGPIEIGVIRIGRGLLHFDPWQFNGTIDEVRIAATARSDAWLMAEAATLGEQRVFAVVGPPQRQGEPAPPPAAFALLSPRNGFEVRKRSGAQLRWTPAAGAESYAISFYAGPHADAPLRTIDGWTATRLPVVAESPEGGELYWTVVAHSATGNTAADERRKLIFYNWSDGVGAPPVDTYVPTLQAARNASFNLQGYLRDRLDRLIREYYKAVPESSPAILQVFRDRDKEPVREPLTPWAGEFAGKYLTGAQLAWRLTHDEVLKNTIDQFVRDLIGCQQADGYLGPFPRASRLTGNNWDVWGHYHCLLGLLLYYEDTQYQPALDACKKAADLLFETFGPGGPTLTNDGGGGQMNMAVCHGLVLLYKKTGIPRYLDLAKYIVHEAWNEPNAGRYLECALAGKPIIEFPQHRWEAMHDWQALPELYWLTGEEPYRRAFEHIWRDAVKGDRHNTGGLTSGEGFTGSPFHTGAIETCCTVAWVAMSLDMLRLTGDPKVADEIEWSTLNSALGAIPYSGRACAYNVPMDGTRLFGVELHWQAPKAGPDLNCCAVNAGRPVGMIFLWGLMEHKDGLAVNFYGPCEMQAELPSGNTVRLTQRTQYPVDGRVAIEIAPQRKEQFTLHLRIPNWSKETSARVNGQPVDPAPVAGTYLALDRAWAQGDRVELDFDFRPRTWEGGGDFEGRVSIFRGPILLAFDARYSDLPPNALPPIDTSNLSIEPAVREGPIEPWVFATIRAADGTPVPVVDFSSAGQTGNYYVSWLPKK